MPNIIPEVTELFYYVRTPTMSDMQTAKKRVGACVEAAATATGCTVRHVCAGVTCTTSDRLIANSCYIV